MIRYVGEEEEGGGGRGGEGGEISGMILGGDFESGDKRPCHHLVLHRSTFCSPTFTLSLPHSLPPSLL